jgi:hypothetical protein
MSNTPIRDTPSIGQQVIEGEVFTQQMQSLHESYELTLNSGKQNEYTVATVPDATKCQACSIMVSDETGGYTMAFSDGANWLRVQDRAIIS